MNPYFFSELTGSVGQDLAVTLTSNSTFSPMLTPSHSFLHFAPVQFEESALYSNMRLSSKVFNKRTNEDIF